VREVSKLFSWHFNTPLGVGGLAFFTTKPTGQETGFGLSLAYDIIKAHGGELKVKTKEDEGTTFIIQLVVKDI